MFIRLDSNQPRLADLFRRATAEVRRQASHLACEHAVAATGVAGPDVVLALEVMSKRGGEPEVRRRLNQLAEEFDDEYFRLDEEDESDREQVSRAFRKARAIAALAFALTDDDGELHEALYEALAACPEPALVSRLETVLETVLA